MRIDYILAGCVLWPAFCTSKCYLQYIRYCNACYLLLFPMYQVHVTHINMYCVMCYLYIHTNIKPNNTNNKSNESTSKSIILRNRLKFIFHSLYSTSTINVQKVDAFSHVYMDSYSFKSTLVYMILILSSFSGMRTLMHLRSNSFDYVG